MIEEKGYSTTKTLDGEILFHDPHSLTNNPEEITTQEDISNYVMGEDDIKIDFNNNTLTTDVYKIGFSVTPHLSKATGQTVYSGNETELKQATTQLINEDEEFKALSTVELCSVDQFKASFYVEDDVVKLQSATVLKWKYSNEFLEMIRASDDDGFYDDDFDDSEFEIDLTSTEETLEDSEVSL